MNDSERFAYIRDKRDYIETGLDFDFDIKVDDENEEISVYFKETDSELDWKMNFDFLPFCFKSLKKNKYIVHRGYALSYLSARTVLLDFFDEARLSKEHYKVFIYGWSYGSAVAGLFLADLKDLNIPVAGMITYGSVKMWYSSVKKLKKYPALLKEYTNPNDFVTWLSPFCHRMGKVKVGDNFSFLKVFKTEWYHTHYDDELILESKN